MTALAGFIRQSPLDPGQPDKLLEAIVAQLRSEGGREPDIWSDGRAAFAKVDLQIFAERAFHRAPSGTVSMLAGEPLLEGVAPGARDADLRSLHDSWDRGDWEATRRARGTFAAAHYDPKTSTLSLITDCLAIRPIYIWIDEGLAVFASVLRHLETLPMLSKTMDARAVTEIASLGYPLATRSPYTEIAFLAAGEVYRVGPAGHERVPYLRWDQLPPLAGMSEGEVQSEAYNRFVSSVAIRQRQDRSAVAFLSGGLDSRCIVAVLRSLGCRVNTFTFAVNGTQEQRFSRAFADRIGTLHTERPLPAGLGWSPESTLADDWLPMHAREQDPTERPRLVWSGDGGSVGVGHAYMGRTITERALARDWAGAATAFLDQQQAWLSTRLFARASVGALSDAVQRGIHEELLALSPLDPVRRFHLVLMLNDQRRHLAKHFEEILRHRLEYQLPFFDRFFLELILGAPASWFARHRFYHRWLARFPEPVTSVPWQSYPGHEPCPVPVAEPLPHQWTAGYTRDRIAGLRRDLLHQAAALLSSANFPSHILDRRFIRIAFWLVRFGFGNYSYILTAAEKYGTYFERAGGRVHVSARTVPGQPSLR